MTVVELARQKVLAAPGFAIESETFLIKSTEPTVNYYFLSKPFAQYFVSWSLPAGDSSIVVSGQANILELENAVVQRVPQNAYPLCPPCWKPLL